MNNIKIKLIAALIWLNPCQNLLARTEINLHHYNYEDWYYKKNKLFKGWKHIVIHHSATSQGNVNVFHRFHTKQGYGGIAYHFVIGNGKGMKDGEIQSTFRWKNQISGTHVSVNSWFYNIFGIGICLVGNLENSPPTEKQKKALKNLILELQNKYNIPNKNITTHGDVPFDKGTSREKTKCPGKNLDLKTIIPSNPVS